MRRRANEIGTTSNSAEKKGSPSEGVAKGGGWGEEFRHARAVAKRFRRLGIKTFRQIGGQAPQNNFQIILRKRFWRAGVKKLKENCFTLMFGLMPNGGNASLRLGRGGIPPPNPFLPPRPRSDCPFFRRNWRPCQFHWRAASCFGFGCG